ncbi:MAG: riboflavin synthase [Halobacteriales archaeon]
MFTGIVETTGEVTAVDADADGRRLSVAAPFADALAPGDSVSVSGACLTVEAAAADAFEVFLAAETLARTSLGDRGVGDRVNLERAMPADGRFDGHLVQGHVDATTELLDVEPVGEDWTYTFALPDGLERYVVEKGSIALDGVSLTVAGLDDGAGRFTVAVIPTTYRETTLGDREPGDRLNVEVDVIAKYVERQLADRP